MSPLISQHIFRHIWHLLERKNHEKQQIFPAPNQPPMAEVLLGGAMDPPEGALIVLRGCGSPVCGNWKLPKRNLVGKPKHVPSPISRSQKLFWTQCSMLVHVGPTFNTGRAHLWWWDVPILGLGQGSNGRSLMPTSKKIPTWWTDWCGSQSTFFDGETKVTCISLGVDMGHVSWTRSHNFHPVSPRDFLVINLDRL